MKKQIVVLSAMLSLCIASVGAKVERTVLEQFAQKADKVRLVQNLLVPTALAAYEYNKVPLETFEILSIAGFGEALKNPGMAAHAALETDPSLLVALSDLFSTMAFADRNHIALARASAIKAGPDAKTVVGRDKIDTLQTAVVSDAVMRIIGEVTGTVLRNKINKMIKTRFNTADDMVKRRIMRAVTFCATKTVTHMLVHLVTTAVKDIKVRAQLGVFSSLVPCMVSVFNLDNFIADTLIPTINYVLAEVEGHVIAQQLIAAEAAAAV